MTFTYLRLKTDASAALHLVGQPSRNLFVAGEMMAGNVLGKAYTAGVGISNRHRACVRAAAAGHPSAFVERATTWPTATPGIASTRTCSHYRPAARRYAVTGGSPYS